MVTKKQFIDLQEKVSKQEEVINKLINKINLLEGKIIQISSEKEISSHINNVLQDQIDSLLQYSKRSCLILEGLPAKVNETSMDVEKSTKEILEKSFNADKNSIANEFDKAHRLGPIFNGHQRVIVRFKSHSFPSKVYYSRKNSTDPRYKLRPCLTQRREDLLEEARSQLSAFDNFDFAFSDLNGNLKVRLKKKINNRNVFNFKNYSDLVNIISNVEDASDAFDKYESEFFSEFEVLNDH